MFGFILLTIAASATAIGSVYTNAACPEVKPVDNFNLKTWAAGKWYEVARYPNKVENGSNCGWAEYSLEGDVFSIKNMDVLKGKLRTVTGSAMLADDAGTTGKMIFSYPYGAGGDIKENKVFVLYNDENTTVVYHCEEDAEKKSRQDFVWIFSRTKTLKDNTKTIVDKVIKDNSFLDGSKLIWPDFSDDACKYEV